MLPLLNTPLAVTIYSALHSEGMRLVEMRSDKAL